jgi:sulfite reductase (NADPH) flavoprotein alpha-component
LNGFFAGLIGLEQGIAQEQGMQEQSILGLQAAPTPSAEEEEFPWHDPTLQLQDRMKLAEGRPLRRVLMAAMGQLDCGQCGYQCEEYAEAIADGAEPDFTKCVPGGKATAKKIKELMASAAPTVSTTTIPIAPSISAPQSAARKASPDAEPGYHRELPLLATLIASTPLTLAGSEKRVQHVALDLGASGLAYEPGDSLGVWVQNNPEEVEIILGMLGARGSEPVTLPDGAVVNAREALTRECDLRLPTASLYWTLARFARSAREAEVLKRLADDDTAAQRLGIHEVINVLSRFPSARPPVAEFAAALGKLHPRLYSIASSQRAHPREVHLTIAVVSYELYCRDYRGVASNYFADRLKPGRRIPIFVQGSHGFRLPRAAATPVIMVGPGTGIAPFRAFLQEREAAGALGPTWLFFGNPRRATDFLYERELEHWRAAGLLSRLDTAFSRDQPNKIYVQHRMRENAPEIWRWLERGANFYVCGDAQRMAADVDHALHQIIAEQGKMDSASANKYVKDMTQAKRYLRDIY